MKPLRKPADTRSSARKQADREECRRIFRGRVPPNNPANKYKIPKQARSCWQLLPL